MSGQLRGYVTVGAELRYLPPYSPDLNPIEKAYSKLKAYLRKIAERHKRAKELSSRKLVPETDCRERLLRHCAPPS